jgi:hypothetical protein
MKISNELFLIREGDFSQSEEFIEIITDINIGIKCVTWHDPNLFLINPVRKANGVVPIKNNFIDYLRQKGWKPEIRMSLAKGINPGAIDAIKLTSYGIFAVEWETGNISSSHRALNKIAVGIIQGQIIGGILILPMKNLAKFLTDRIGNFEELTPYFPMYQKMEINEGVIAVIGIDYDGLDNDAPLIPKGKDGNAKKGFDETWD